MHPHQGVLVNLAVRSEHGMDHELVIVLHGWVVLERLKTDGDGDLIARVHNPGVGLDAVPGRKIFTSHFLKIFGILSMGKDILMEISDQ